MIQNMRNQINQLIKHVVAIIMTATSGSSIAAYDANIIGEVVGFWTYTFNDHIYFQLKNQPTSHNGCNPVFFVIPDTVSADRRKALLSRLSIAYITKEQINIGYSANGDCGNGYINVFRVG